MRVMEQSPLSTEVSDVRMAPDLSSSSDGDGDGDADAAAFAAGPSMQDSSPLGALPMVILERALAFLPFPYIFRVRSVCKRWNALICSAWFQESSSRCHVPWGQFHLPRLGWKGGASPSAAWSSYDLSEGKWVTVPHLEFPVWARNTAWNLIAANGGLLCFGALDARRISVCNPMTKRWKELPSVSLDSRAPVISHMIVDKPTNSYKILFAGNAAYKEPDARCGMVDLYDSVANTWTAAERLPGGMTLKSGAYCNSKFYCLTRHFLTGLYSVMVLDLTKLRWRDDVIRIPEGFENYPYIVACSGQVYLVGGRSDVSDRTPMASIGIFQLDPSLSEWSKVSEYLDSQFLQSTGAIYGCGAHGSRIYVVTHAYDMWVAVYNTSTGLWEEPIKGNFFDMKDIFETKFAFQPNLHVSP